MRILSGAQPTGPVHFGNYYGAVRQWIDLQAKGDAYYFIADYHGLTTVRDPKVLAENVFSVACDYLALGLDPQSSVLWRQSDVPEVCELTWILMTVAPMGLLERCHAYKDKVAKGLPADAGLFSYPVLMAADILLYDSNLVPVGDDQKQHVEVTRDLAVKLNMQVGKEVLTLPEPYILEEVARVPGVDGQKMSSSYGNDIQIFDTEKRVKKKIMSIVTDSLGVEDKKEPAGNVIYELFKLVRPGASTEELAERFRAGGMGYGDAKKALLEAFLDTFGPMRARRDELFQKPDEVEEVLRDGARRARMIAREVLERVRDSVGISGRVAE